MKQLIREPPTVTLTLDWESYVRFEEVMQWWLDQAPTEKERAWRQAGWDRLRGGVL